MREIIYRGRDGCPLRAFVARQCSTEPPLLLLHGGGPDHHSLVPLARLLDHERPVILPDIRGYGRSICRDPACHTWSQYVDDVASLLDFLDVPQAVIGGAGLGGTVALRFALERPERVAAAIVISMEDIEDDEAKAAELAFMEAFAVRVREHGVEAAWAPILGDLAPVIGAMVREALPRSDPASAIAAAAIGRDRSFRSISELDGLAKPVLIFAGMDERHPAALAKALATRLARGRLAEISMTDTLLTAEDFAKAFAPPILEFLATEDLADANCG